MKSMRSNNRTRQAFKNAAVKFFESGASKKEAIELMKEASIQAVHNLAEVRTLEFEAQSNAPSVAVHQMGNEVLLEFHRKGEDDGVWLVQSQDNRTLFTGMSFDGEQYVDDMPANNESHPKLFDIQLVNVMSESDVETKAAVWYVAHKDEIEKLFPIRPVEED